jgi:type IV fimbrial biogenesis protein FimT
MQGKSFPDRQRGVTLIECCATLAIVGILAGTALPSFDSLVKTHRLEGQAAEMAIDLRYVRSEAVARNQGVRVSFHSTAGGTCTLIHTGSTADCNCDSSGTASCTGGSSVLKTLFQPYASGMSIDANVASMRFDPNNGTVTPAATVRVTGADGRAIHHVVNILGRVRSCSPAGAMPGLKPC